ncbi:hypothetical protein Dimus_034014 [Dionaea muscipula]
MIVVIHLKKKDVVKSSVKGVAIEFDHDKVASVLGVPGKNGMREYIKDVWEESSTRSHLRLLGGLRNDEAIMDLGREILEASWISLTWIIDIREIGEYARVMMRHMSYVISVKDHELPELEKIGEGMMMMKFRKERVGEEEKDQTEFDWEAVIDEAAEQGESGSDDRFLMLEWMLKSRCEPQRLSDPVPSTIRRRKRHLQSRTLVSHLLAFRKSVMNKMLGEFERSESQQISR